MSHSTKPGGKPLTRHQQELVNVVKATHQNLIVARKVKTQEIDRRLTEARIQAERDWAKIEATIRLDVDAEIAAFEAAEDEAIIAAYENGVPVRRIALDGFGNRLDGAVHAKLRDLRKDGRVGNVEGYQRRDDEAERVVAFPQPVDVDSVLAERTTLNEPTFTLNPEPLILVDPAPDGSDPGITVPAVTLELDERDPWFASIQGRARRGTPYAQATTVTLYLHPATGELTTHESKETGDLIWDHPVARWVKDHQEDALAGYLLAAE
jgi:hypothetical protein